MSDNVERLGIQLYIDDSALKNGGVSLDVIKRSLGDLSKITEDLSKKLGSTFGSDLEKNAKSLSGKLSKFLGFDKLGDEAKSLKQVFTNALTLEGVTNGISKLQKVNDTMVQVGKTAYNVTTQTEQLQKVLTKVVEAGKVDTTTFKIFSKDKLEAEIASVQASLQKLRTFAEKNDLDTSAVGSLNTKAVNATTLDELTKIKAKAVELKSALDLTLTFGKLDGQAEKLRSSFANVKLPAELATQLATLSKDQFADSERGTAKYGKALAQLRVQLEQFTLEQKKATQSYESYLAALSKQGYKMVDGGYVKKSALDLKAALDEAYKVSSKTSTTPVNTYKADLANLAPLKASLTDIQAAIKLTSADIRNLPVEKFRQLTAALAPFKVTINDATGELKKFKSIADWLPESFQKMGARLMEFYSLRTVLFAVGNQFREAITGAIDFNQNIHDIAAIAGSSRSEMEGLGQSILSIAKNSRFSADEVAGLMQVLAQAGIKARDLGEVSSVVGKFATATASKPEVAADVFTTSLTVFKKEASESTDIANALTAALNNSKLTTEGLATAFNYLAPQAAQFGMSMEQTLGVVAGMSQAGVKASTIGTGASQLLKELAVPKERLRNLLEYYSIKTDEVNPKLHTFAEIVETLNQAVGRSGEKGVQAEHLFAALESRVGRSVVTAVTLGADTFTNMTNSITGTNAAIVAFEKTMEGPRAKINVLKQEVLSVAVSIGNALGPALAGVTDFATSAVRGLSTVPGALLALTAGIGGLVVAVNALTVAAMANPIIAGVVIGVVALTGVMALLGTETDELTLKSKAQHKAYIEMAESTQRVKDVTSAAIVEAERKNKSLKEYTDLLAGNEAQQRRAVKLGDEHVTLNHETKRSLHDLKDAHKDWFENIDLENLKLSDLYTVLQRVNAERSKGLKDSVAVYNEAQTKINELEPKIAAKKPTQYEMNKPANERNVGKVFKQSALAYYTDFSAGSLRSMETELDKAKKVKQEVSSQFNSKELMENYKKDDIGRWVQKSPEEVARDKKAQEEMTKKSSVSAIPKSSKGAADKAESYLSTVEKEIAKGDAEIAKNLKEQYKEIMTDVKETYEIRNEAYKFAQRILSDEFSAKVTKNNVMLGQQFASAHKGVKYNAEQDTLSGVDENSGVFKKYLEAKQKQTKGLTEEYNKQKSQIDKDFLEIEKKSLEKYEGESKKIQEDAAKREADLRKKVLEDKFANSTDAAATIEAYYAYIAAAEEKVAIEYARKREDLLKEYNKWSPEKQADMGDKFWSTYTATYGAEQDAKSKIKTETDSAIIAKGDSRVAKKEKQLGYDLTNANAALNIQKQSAWTQAEVDKIEASIYENTIKNTQAKQKEVQIQADIFQQQVDAGGASEELTAKAEEYKQKLKEINATLAEQKLKYAQLSDTSFWGNFTQGMQKSVQAFGSFKSLTQELGASLTSTALNGVTSSISSAVTTMFNPDTQKIAELNAQIASLRAQKSTLESDISVMEGNTTKTPEEIKLLQDKKVALDGVNASLAQQEEAVRRQKDGWASFADGMKNAMKKILEALQEYIIKLFVVWAAEQMVNGIKGMFGASSGGVVPSSGSTVGSSLQTNGSFLKIDPQFKANGGLIQHFAEGGLSTAGGAIPTNIGTPGKDSVPAMLMPGEVVIRKSAVDYYGVDKLLALNEGKIAKFADGGFVGGGAQNNTKDPSKQTPFTLQIVNVANPDSVPKQPVDAQQVINIISYSAAQKGDVYKTIKGVLAS